MILALETSSSLCAVCILDAASGQVAGEISHDIGRGHAERLMDDVSEALKQAGVGYSDLTAIACGAAALPAAASRRDRLLLALCSRSANSSAKTMTIQTIIFPMGAYRTLPGFMSSRGSSAALMARIIRNSTLDL